MTVHPRAAAAGLVPLLLSLLSGCVVEPAEEPPDPASSISPLFTDVTDRAGITFVHDNGGRGRKYIPEVMGSGVCVLDFDQDGWMDLYLVQSGPVPGSEDTSARQPNALLRNRGDGTFEDITPASGAGDDGYGMGCVAADYDGDGDTDLYVLNFGRNTLLRREADGRFRDVTDEAGVGDTRWGSSGAFFDADGDGDLDLYVANYLDFTVASHVDCGDLSRGLESYCHPDVYEMTADAFYRNEGDGTFQVATTAAGFSVASGKGMGVVASDLDRDGWTDLYVANDSTPNFYWRNLGKGRFREIALEAGVGYNEEGRTEAGMGMDIGDINRDGRPDIFVTNLSREANALYVSGGEGYRYASRELGIYRPSFLWTGFGADLLDLDNDGDLDLFVTNGHVIDNIEAYDDVLSFRQPSQAFRNDGAGHFEEVTAGEAGDISTARVGRGSATLDYDNDGRLDLLVSFNDDRARLFRNTGTEPGNWIGFLLVGNPPNTDAVGARITVTAGGRTLTEERRAGGSYQSSHDPRLHFGLGEADQADLVRIEWPDGTVQELRQISGFQYLRMEKPRLQPILE